MSSVPSTWDGEEEGEDEEEEEEEEAWLESKSAARATKRSDDWAVCGLTISMT